MPGYVEDRWYKKGPNGRRNVRTDLYGKGKRYKVTGVPGVRARSFPDGEKAAADRFLSHLLSEQLEHGDAFDPARGEILLEDYIESEWWPHRTSDPLSLVSIRTRVNHIVRELGSYRLKQIKTPHLREFLKTLSQKVGPGTALDIWNCLAAIMQAAVDDERIRKNPCKTGSLTLPTRPRRKARAWPRERVLAIRAGLPERYRPMVDVASCAGLRLGEVLGLTEEDLDEAAGVIHVRRQVKAIGAKLVFAWPKNDKVREVPAPPNVFEALKLHVKEHPPVAVTLPWGDPAPPANEREAEERAPQTHQLLFTSAEGKGVRQNVFTQYAWKPALAAAGVIPPPIEVRVGKAKETRLKYVAAREYGFHSLRHTFASVMLDSGQPITAVSKWMGHANPAITLRIYAHMMPDADGRGRAAMQKWIEDQS